jgi:hypothetical protein
MEGGISFQAIMANRFRVPWMKYLAAILVGNLLYFSLSPYLPAAARHEALVDWGTFVDLLFCVFVYGLIELASFLIRRS